MRFQKWNGLLISICLLCLLLSPVLAQEQKNEDPGKKDVALADTSLAKKYSDIALTFYKVEAVDSAITYFKLAADIYEGLVRGKGMAAYAAKLVYCYNKMSAQLLVKNSVKKAEDYLNKAITVADSHLAKKHADVAETYLLLGNLNYFKGKFDKALHDYERALAIQTHVLGKENTALAITLSNIGMICTAMRDYDKALYQYHKAKLIAEADSSQEAARGLASVSSGMAEIYWIKGDYEKALVQLSQALSIYLELYGPENNWVAQCYGNMGNIYTELADYGRALDFYFHALSISQELWGENHQATAVCYNNLSNIYSLLGDYDKALKFGKKALQAMFAIYRQKHPDAAYSYDGIGGAHFKMGHYQEALAAYQKALAIRREMLGSDIAVSYQNLGNLYIEMGQYGKARKNCLKALETSVENHGHHHSSVANVYQDLARVNYSEGYFKQALQMCQKSIAVSAPDFDEQQPTANPELQGVLFESELLNTLSLKGDILKARSQNTDFADLKMAMETYELAARLLRKMSIGFKTVDSKLSHFEQASGIYDKAVAVALRLHVLTKDVSYKKTAFVLTESGKTNLLDQSLRESKARSFAGIPDTLLAREHDLKIDLAFYDTELQKERHQKEGEQNKEVLQKFERKYFAVKNDYDALLERFEKNYPKYYALKYETEKLSTSDVQSALDDATTVLEYLVGEQAVYIFLLTRNHFDVTTIAKDSLFEINVSTLRQSVDDYTSKKERYVASARAVYKMLIKPVQAQLKTQKLVIIPDVVTAHIPFEALLTEDVAESGDGGYSELPYLLKKYAISYAYSAKLLLLALAEEKQPKQDDYFAFAPVFPDGIPDDTRAVELVTANFALDTLRADYAAQLLASRDEVLGIQDLFRERYGLWQRWFGKDKTRVLLEDEANEENLKRANLQDYRYLHFATHAFANKNTPELSGMLCAQDTSSTEDGILFLPEVYNLELDAELVALSACESGAGKLAKGEGLLGLSRGFLYAGARNLLVSLWEVRDTSTRDFMLSFYEQMLAGKSKTEALRGAKLALMHARPYYWAPFILIGQ